MPNRQVNPNAGRWWTRDAEGTVVLVESLDGHDIRSVTIPDPFAEYDLAIGGDETSRASGPRSDAA